MNALQRAIEAVGGQTELAHILGVSPQAVHQWLGRGQPPPLRVLAIEKATRGRVTRYELRPDVYGE